MSKRVLLFYPPQHCHKELFQVWSFDYSCHLPLALLKLSTYLKGQGHSVDYLDCFNIFDYNKAGYDYLMIDENIVRHAPYGNYREEGREVPIYHIGYSYEEIKSRLQALEGSPDEVYISSLFTWSWQTTHESIKLIKELFPDAWVKLGGIYPTLCPEHAATAGADELVLGGIPEVEHCWLDKEHYNFEEGSSPIPFRTSLGCPNNCSYCAVGSLEGRQLKYRDIPDLLAEINSFHRECKAAYFHFWDSNILVKPEKHLFKILAAMRKENPELQFMCPGGIQPNLVTKEIAAALRKYNCVGIRLTIETTDMEQMKEQNRPCTLSHLEKAIDNLLAAGYTREELSAVLLIGRPGQRVDDILTDIIRVYSYGVATVFSVYTPIPGTADYVRYKEHFSERSLEDLDPLLYPLASPDLNTRQLDIILKYFTGVYVPLEYFREVKSESPIISRMQEIIKENKIDIENRN